MHNDPHTAAVHSDRDLAELPDVAPPLRPATTFDRSPEGPVYRREGPRTVARLEAVLGTLEGGSAVFYPSGLGAVASLLRHLAPGHVAVPGDVYHGTRDFVLHQADRGLWKVIAETAGVASGDVVLIESPSNPKCLVHDIEQAAETARVAGALTIVDSTFATPVLQRPLDLGADFVVHSTTKFINGHSDAMGGVVVTRDEEATAALLRQRWLDGMVPGELETWLTLRGVRTLPLRIEWQSRSAAAIAEWLESRVERVWYPGLAGHPGHALAERQMSMFGGVLAFELADADSAQACVERLEIFRIATSLGGVESLAEHRLVSDPDAPPGLIRLSIGLESPESLLADLEQALG